MLEHLTTLWQDVMNQDMRGDLREKIVAYFDVFLN